MEEKTPFPRSKIRQKEIFDLFAMYALMQELDKAQRDMAGRLQVIPEARMIYRPSVTFSAG